MLFRRHHHPPIGRKFVRFTVAITSAMIAIFVVYFHGSFIDAFSLGCRKLPSTQVFNQQVSQDPSSPAVILTRIPPSSSSRLEMKGENDNNDSPRPFFVKRELDKSEKIIASSNNDTPSPFFAKREDQFQMNSESSILNQDVKIADNSYDNLTSPFFANKEDQLQVLRESLGLDKLQSNEDVKEVDSSSGDSASPFFATKEDQFPVLGESLNPDESVARDYTKISGSGTGELTSPFFAAKEDQSESPRESLVPDESESNDDLKKIESTASDFSPPFFTKRKSREPSNLKQQPQKPSFDRASFTPIERIPINSQSTTDSEEERKNSIAWPRFQKDEYSNFVDSSQAMGDETSEIFNSNTMNTVLEVIKGLPSKVDKAVDTSQKIIKDVQDVTRKMNESIQATKQTMEKTVEKTQETVKNVQDFSSKLKQSLDVTKQTVEENVEKTQEVVKDVEDFSNKVKQSLEVTKQSVEEKVEKTQKVVENVQEVSKKITESKAASKAKVLLQLEPPTTLTEEALDLAGKATIAAAKLTLWGTKGLGSLALKGSQSIYDKTIGPEVEEVWNEQMESLNGSVEKATGVWNEQVESLNDSVEKATGAWTEQLESLHNSVEKATLFVKNTPSRVKSAVTESINEVRNANDVSDAVEEQPPSIQQDSASVLGRGAVKDEPSSTAQNPATVARSTSTKTQPPWIKRGSASVSSSTDGENQPAFVSKKEVEADHEDDDSVSLEDESEEDSIMPVENIVSKSPDELNRELDEAEKLAREISGSLDAAERAMKVNSNVELDEPMIEIKKKSIDKIETIAFAAGKKAKLEKKNKRKSGMKNVLSRFKPPSFKTAKTKNDLDSELKEAESLVKEIADALDTAEQALATTSESIESIEKDIDELTDKTIT